MTSLHEKELLAQYRAECESLTKRLIEARGIATTMMEENTKLMNEMTALMGENTRLAALGHEGIKFVHEPVKDGLIRIDQMNLGWLKNMAMHRIWGHHAGTTIKKGFNTTHKDGTLRVTDELLEPIAINLAAQIEDASGMGQEIGRDRQVINDAIEEVVNLFKDENQGMDVREFFARRCEREG